jgi:hypothetical protein
MMNRGDVNSQNTTENYPKGVCVLGKIALQ